MTGASRFDGARPGRSQTAIFTRLARELMGPVPPVFPFGTTIGDVIPAMSGAGVSSVVIVDARNRVAGIITERDIARRVVFRLPPDRPVETVMTRPVATVAANDYLYRAIARMRRLNLRHMPVVDAEGQPIGILRLHEALADATSRMMAQIDRLTQESSIEGLSQVKQAQAELASELLADNLPAPDIQALISDINHDLHRRVLEAAIESLANEGWGRPPVAFTLLIMGSGGRNENFLFPDQDNGFMLADYLDDEHGRIDPYFIALAERFNQQLDAIGFPLCKGNVMARNPLWRKTASQWRRQVEIWARSRSPVAVLFADIFFDFRSAWGPDEPAAELRRFVGEVLRAYPALLSMMCADETSRSVALGWFGRIITRADGDHPGRVDLKMRGTMPLVASVRLWALREGVAATGTLARIAALAEKGRLDRDEADSLAAAFEHVTFVLLRQQLADFHAGRRVGNFVDPKTLSRRDRDQLVAALRAIERYRVGTRSEFTGAVF